MGYPIMRVLGERFWGDLLTPAWDIVLNSSRDVENAILLVALLHDEKDVCCDN